MAVAPLPILTGLERAFLVFPNCLPGMGSSPPGGVVIEYAGQVLGGKLSPRNSS